ncbi:hypothetical protein PFICI_09192 [Pestalotiopsis fici W106-1]|uniref:Uncharacterized protein n=1 Tax=Pestalotiopsis fici (strain W106-1 / CGMCC3.15140) TaxID=1229662 RepID=W3WZZ9_PESFW|nr:uncharacterized protein PFICI_09192 [Pestalotiopsis fici W106-1]ETS79339.1 hypothetical protein PFICI_09192 [Pestalotiopsis fici W106-1]
MSQQPQSAKRMRSNTSNNEFTPQTAPALRGRPSQLDAAAAASVALYSNSVNVYDSSAFTTIPSTRQDVAYGSYVAAAPQHSDYPAAAAAYAAAAEPYDPHPHANSYIIAHGLPPPADYNPPYGGYYSPDLGLASIQNGSYSPVTARHSTSVGPDSYSPSPIPTSSTATSLSDIQAHSAAAASAAVQHSLSQQFEDVYGTQPVSHSSAHHHHHAQTLSYPDAAVVNSQYTPPTDSVINSQYNAPTPGQLTLDGHHHSPMPSRVDEQEDSDEDAQGETADEADLSEIHPSPVSTTKPVPSLKRYTSDETSTSKSSETKCACKKGRGKKKASCGNPFQDLSTFFGPPTKFPKPCDANPCFATWLSNQPNIEELDLDLMVDMLLYDDASWASLKKQTKAFKDWEDKWLKAKNAKSKKLKEDRERLEFELLRGALGNCNSDDFHGFWYSFCRGQWVPMDDWEHCRECKNCAPSSDWHCEQHNRCTSNGTCAECAAASTPYSELSPYPVTA